MQCKLAVQRIAIMSIDAKTGEPMTMAIQLQGSSVERTHSLRTLTLTWCFRTINLSAGSMRSTLKTVRTVNAPRCQLSRN